MAFKDFQTLEERPCRCLSSHLEIYQWTEAYFESFGRSFTSMPPQDPCHHDSHPLQHIEFFSVSSTILLHLGQQSSETDWFLFFGPIMSDHCQFSSSPNQLRFSKTKKKKQITNLLRHFQLSELPSYPLIRFLPNLFIWFEPLYVITVIPDYR